MTVETQRFKSRQPVNQQIYRILRRITHCLDPRPHAAIRKEVSTRFNVSRQPVREAFIKLAENGLMSRSALSAVVLCEEDFAFRYRMAAREPVSGVAIEWQVVVRRGAMIA